MDDKIACILSLPDELLLAILKKLNNIDALYSLVDIHEKLDRVVCDANCSRTVDLTTILPHGGLHDSLEDHIINRFQTLILSHIHKYLKSLTVEAVLFQNILHMNNYPNLHMLTLHNLEGEVACRIFTSMLLDLSILTQIIRKLIVCSFLQTSNHAFSDDDQGWISN
ncbi:hypothetical protein I4U23_025315 [Adineta vaga]|nr:hypothetical protein I4U23_025315 [Adineta vaga]